MACIRNSLGYRPLSSVKILSICLTALLGTMATPALSEPVEQADILQKLVTIDVPGEEFGAGLREMVNFSEYAVQSKPRSVEHRVGLVDAYTMLWCFGYVPREDILSTTKQHAAKAIQLDPQDAGAHTALGMVKLSQWDWQAAEQELSQAVELAPKRAASRHWYALYLASRGRHKEALAQSKQAVTLDKSPGTQTGMGAVLYFARDWQQMIKVLSPLTKKHADFAPAYDWLGMAYVQEKKYEESLAAYEHATEVSGGMAEIAAGLGHAYGLAGEQDKARKVLDALQRWSNSGYVPPVQVAYVHLALGETDKAFEKLEQAYQQHSWELVFLQVEPWFDEIRSDSRFAKLAEKMKFPPVGE